jgi:XTP/dITP diphosphohydrolase
VRTTERAIAAGRRDEDVPEELDVASVGAVAEDEWRVNWRWKVVASDTEPAPDRVPEPGPVEVPEPGPLEVPEPSPQDVPEPSPQDVSVGVAGDGNGVELQDQEVIVETR